MELYSDHVQKIKGFLEAWANAPETKPVEVEASFGQVDIQTFLRVVSYLTEVRKLSSETQIEYLNIGVDNSIRFTITGSASVRLYCENDNLNDYTVQQKNKAGALPVDIVEYGVRVKSATEVDLDNNLDLVKEIVSNWSQKDKYFRLIKRWSFEDKKRGVRFDLSMIRSTKKDKRTKSAKITSFSTQDIMSYSPTYEIEVELVRGSESFNDLATNKDLAWKALYLSMGDILRAIQGSPILISKTLKQEVLKDYDALVGNVVEAGNRKFLGVGTVTLKKDNMDSNPTPGTYNICKIITKLPDNKVEDSYYNVTDKADGLRCMGLVRDNGELFLIDMNFNVYRTGLSNLAVKNSLVDGEYITRNKAKKPIVQFAIFDYYIGIGNNKEIRNSPFYVKDSVDTRHRGLENWISAFQGGLIINFNSKFNIGIKSFIFASDKKSIFKCADDVLKSKNSRDYYQDGLIFTPNILPIPINPTWFAQFKWKPAQDNTIDFLIKIEKDPQTPTEDLVVQSISFPSYKIIKLYVGGNPEDNPRELYLSEESTIGQGKKYSAIPFSPIDPPDVNANICYRELKTNEGTGISYIETEDKEIISDNSIVEMKYDLSKDVGWRWVPTRIRQDKTEKFRKGIYNKTFNNNSVANDIWNSIHDPIDESMITTGESSSKSSLSMSKTGVYYNRDKINSKDIQKTEPMRDFHKKIIKGNILCGAIKKYGELKNILPKILDLACGHGGDLTRYLMANAGFILGVDLSPNNINNKNDGAYRYLIEQRKKRKSIPPIFYAVADSSINLPSGDAGASEEDKIILKSIFGQTVDSLVPKRVISEGKGQLKNGADACSLMYALHYFFGDEAKLKGLLENVRATLKIGGLFVGTNFDGEKIYSEFRGKEKNTVIVGEDDTSKIWEITKNYDDREELEMPKEFGLEITIQFASISSESMTEYLVPWELQLEKFREYGLELVPNKDYESLGLVSSSELYENTIKLHKNLKMNEASLKYSKFHRWWVFRRVGDGSSVDLLDTAKIAQKAELIAQTSEIPGSFTAAVAVEETLEAVKPVEAVKSIVQTYNPKDIFKIDDTSLTKPAGSKEVLGEFFQDFPGRFLSPSARFDYKDGDEVYPSFWNYYYGLQFKYLNDVKLQNKRLDYQTTGKLWQASLKELNKHASTSIEYRKALLDNKNNVQKQFIADMKAIKSKEGTWDQNKDAVLKIGLGQRFAIQMFKNMICRIMQKGKVLLFDDNNLDLGGSLLKNGTIEGQNLYGKYLMEIGRDLC